MNRLDRALGILLLLRSGQPMPASDLALRFGVSTRTIYRDIDALSALGLPVYAEMGRNGGFRLVEGYFLPPVMFSTGEAVSLLLGLNMLRRLQARPFAAELETSERKLLAAVPDRLFAILSQTQQIIGFEEVPFDIFHPEPPPVSAVERAAAIGDGEVVELFLQAILDRQTLQMEYRSPYGSKTTRSEVTPCGLLWDRDRWYLVGRRTMDGTEIRLWRADRVLAARPYRASAEPCVGFDVNALLNHSWLSSAMEAWRDEAPVKIKLLPGQASRLQKDWYYRHARFERLADGQVMATFGEENQEVVFELMRWLGPGAELVQPREWRSHFRRQLVEMLALYGA